MTYRCPMCHNKAGTLKITEKFQNGKVVWYRALCTRCGYYGQKAATKTDAAIGWTDFGDEDGGIFL